MFDADSEPSGAATFSISVSRALLTTATLHETT